jgi:DNA-binding MarR family transcriptional regulator
MNTKPEREEQLVLELLDAVGERSDLSQRHLASRMGVALGLANSYLRRCIRKGLIKISEAPANRYLYYLTPKGFSEKGRLTAKYLSSSFAFYRRAGQSCVQAFERCAANGWPRVLLCGDSDLAEIALLRATETPVGVVGIYDRLSTRARFAGKPVWHEFGAVNGYDACLVTDLATPLATYEDLTGRVAQERVLVPDILGIAPAR